MLSSYRMSHLTLAPFLIQNKTATSPGQQSGHVTIIGLRIGSQVLLCLSAILPTVVRIVTSLPNMDMDMQPIFC